MLPSSPVRFSQSAQDSSLFTSSSSGTSRVKAVAVSRRALLSPDSKALLEELPIKSLSLEATRVDRTEKRQLSDSEGELCRQFKFACMMPPSLKSESGEDDLRAYLQYWVALGESAEKRGEAQNRILEAFRNLSSISIPVRLDLVNLGLRDLPMEVFKLTLFQKLKGLSVGSNLLSSIPEEIRNLKALDSLYLNDNRLTELPDWIGSFSELKVLSIALNKLTALPSSIGNLKKLEALLANQNAFQSLPDSLATLPSLTVLDATVSTSLSFSGQGGGVFTLRFHEILRDHFE